MNGVLGNYFISKHAVERYEERVGLYSNKNARQCIKQDLHFTRIKRIVRKPDGTTHVFARHSVEFVFIKRADSLILKTVIKRTRDTNKHSINKRERQKNKDITSRAKND